MSLKDEIKELEDKIEELKKFSKEKNIDFSEQIGELEKGLENKYRDFTENEMDSWERIQISRNSKRPYTLDYIEILTQDFVELHGDRLSKDDHAIVGGLASVDGYKILIIGHQKGRDLDSNMFRNFGMASPEGYRKALRLQGEAIAKNLAEMFGLKVPIVSVIIGEGGSGGALGIGVADSVLMLENSVYSVISPEGCASILFNDSTKAAEAAKSLKMDAISLKSLGVIDDIIEEPLGGAHRNLEKVSKNLKAAVLKEFKRIDKYSLEELLEKRYEKFRSMGEFFENAEV